MDKTFWKGAAAEVLKASLSTVAFSLFSLALAAVFVRATAPAHVLLVAVNWILKGLGAFAFCLLFVRRERALFKGIAAGMLSSVFTLLLFAAIGGGFRVDALFLAELALTGLAGGLGGLLGAKLRKE